MSESTNSSGNATADRRSDPAMRQLYQMSRTAGVGLADYAAVNAVSVVALIAGLASFLAVIFRDTYTILALPGLAIVLGLIGFFQVRRSSGTQTGAALAVLGIVAAVAFGGFNLVSQRKAAAQDAQFRKELESLSVSFGQNLVAKDFSAAYEKMDPRTRERILLTTFTARIEPIINGAAYGGKVLGVSLGDHLLIERDDTGTMLADGLLVVDLDIVNPQTGKKVQASEQVRFSRFGQDWKIAGIKNWLPPEIDDRKPAAPAKQTGGPA